MIAVIVLSLIAASLHPLALIVMVLLAVYGLFQIVTIPFRSLGRFASEAIQHGMAGYYKSKGFDKLWTPSEYERTFKKK